MPPITAKYRPYLTLQQLHYFIELCNHDDREETASIRNKTIKELKLFIFKNDLDMVKPQYVTSPKETVEEKLGLALDSVDPSIRRKAAYDLYTKYPHLCTPHELEQAALYRYENDLMTPEEEAEYESLL